MASSEFLTNKEQGNWAEQIVFNAVNANSEDYCAVNYGWADSIAAGDLGFAKFYSEYQDELNNIGKKPDILIFRRSDAPSTDLLDTDDDIVRRAVAAIEVRSSSFLANKYASFMDARTRKAEAECSRIQGELMQEPLSSLLLEKSPAIYRLIESATVDTFRDLDFRAISWSSSADLRRLSEQLKLSMEVADTSIPTSLQRKLSTMLDYLQVVGEEHRKRFGQFFTPDTVAAFMVHWVLDSGMDAVFDPAFGLGAFRTAIDCDSVQFTGCEVDATIVEFWERNTGERADFIAIEDYLRTWGSQYASIVCNPPYMRFQKFLNRDVVAQEFDRNLGIKLSGYVNTASAFLLKSLSELSTRGRLAYIMPLEFLNAGYGMLVKQKLIESGHLCSIISFDCEKDIFPDATTSVGIILYDKAVYHIAVQFFRLQSIDELAAFESMQPVAEVPRSALDPQAKWLPYFQGTAFKVDRQKTTTLAHFGKFSRGIATGANAFFVLNPTSVTARRLDATEYVPCIARSAQVRTAVFRDADFANNPVFLFSVPGNPSKAAADYIRFGESEGYHERFLTKNRTPWYKTEKRSPSPLLFGVFSRNGYKVVLNKTKALNLTCYHGFQPNLLGAAYLEHLFLYLSSQAGRQIVARSMRQYGQALDKFEPNDLNDALVPTAAFFDTMPKERVAAAIRSLEETGELPEWAEAVFAPLHLLNAANSQTSA